MCLVPDPLKKILQIKITLKYILHSLNTQAIAPGSARKSLWTGIQQVLLRYLLLGWEAMKLNKPTAPQVT